MTSSVAQLISCEAQGKRAVTARIFNIQRYSLNDGQGIRTVVFFKGCPHRCPWCANPESLSPSIVTVRRMSKCLRCEVCLQDADECPSGAFERIGRDVTLEALLKEVVKDEIFYRASGGGVTLSGGEVLMQADFATQLLKTLRQSGIHTAIETAGDAPLTRLQPLARQCDEVLFDLKIMDNAQAKALLNINQSRVLQNFLALVQEGIKVIPRVPLIPGYTLDEKNLRDVLDFLRPTGLSELHLLPFHSYGEPKYRLLGEEWSMKTLAPPSSDEIDAVLRMAEAEGFHVTVGG